MNLEEAKAAVERVEADLPAHPLVVAHTFVRDDRKLHLALTERLRKRCRKGRVWKSRAFLTAFKNAEYGFNPDSAHSPGGADGIFLLTRDHTPPNAMMKKLFTQFLDRQGSGAEELAKALSTKLDALIPVRLVSHHMRLLGLLRRGETEDTLVLVDYDDSD